MSLFVVLPVRPFDEGKCRLATVLSASERARLNARFFSHVLGVATQLVAAERCIVVSRAPEVLDIAFRRGCGAVREAQESDLNAALTLTGAEAVRRGASSVMSLSSDLPFLCVPDLHCLLDIAVTADIALATDRAGTGTNAMAASPPGAIPYCYGADSLARHLQQSEIAGLSARVVRRPGLAIDIDVPADLESLCASWWSSNDLPSLASTSS